jgi:hypothetical protein
MTVPPTCSKCSSAEFAVSDTGLKNADRRVAFVHCASCGATIGLLEVEKNQPLPRFSEKDQSVIGWPYQVEL